MHLANYPGKYQKNFIKERALEFLGDKWTVIEDGEDLFLDRKGIDVTLLMHRSRTLRRDSITFIHGVRLKFFPDRVEASVTFNHTFYILMFLAVATMILLFKGKKKLQDVALVGLGAGIFYFVVTDKLMKELRKIF
jgi:hypothetical protein